MAGKPLLEGVEYYEYDCGFPCTEDGCLGHETDIPISITLNGVTFEVYGSRGGDYPGSDDKDTIRRVKEVIAILEKIHD